jgi:hypothetical protein
MELALLYLIAAVLGGGVSGALLTTWSVHRRLRSLEFHLVDLERVIMRETKRRAGGERWSKADAEAELLAKQLTAKPPMSFDNDWKV